MAATDHEEAQLRSVALQNARSIVLARRRAEEVLRKQSEWLRVTLSSIGDAVISTDAHGLVSFMNGVAESLTGWTHNEAIGQALDAVFRIVNESTREGVENPAMRVLREGAIVGLANHTILIAKDGTERPIDDSAAPINDEKGYIAGCVLVFRDVTERRRAEDALRRSERELAEFFENANVGLHWVGPDGIILRANQAELDLLGYSREEYVGRHIAEFHVDQPEIDKILDCLLRAENLHEYPARMRCKDGSIRDVLVNSSGFFENGEFIHSRCFTHDITDRKRAEQKLTDANRRKDEFLATLSHELRNPLAPIRNAVQILKTISPATPTLEWCRDLIDNQVVQMARLMEDLLDLTLITHNSLELRKQPADLGAVIEGAIETSRPLIEAGRHQLTVNLPQQKMMLDGDPARLMQVFANLLNNAAKYTEPDGQIHVKAELDPRAEQEVLQEVVVSIKDSGIGIAPELMLHLFEMFFQADRSKERHYGGLGIGLTLALHIVELHGGRIEVKSEGLGTGSEFAVRLPLAKKSGERDEDSVRASNKINPRSRRLSKSVLVVDDNKNQVESIAMLLKILGCEVRAAHDGLSALEALKEFIPEFALIDIGLPGIDGFELARRIRKVDEFRNIVLIAQTGWGREEDRAESRQAGFNYHLVKPLDFQLLERILTGAEPLS
jgi:PAS domain S-box-containing protein